MSDFPWIDGKTRIYGVVGDPVEQSLSPAMHNAAFASAGINAVYVALRVCEPFSGGIATAAETLGLSGFNVTAPYKNIVMAQLDSLSEKASFLESVNTVVKTEGGWFGDSTDGDGLVQSLKENEAPPEKKIFLVRGAGGSASAVVFALAEHGASAVHVINRTPSRSQTLIGKMKTKFPDTFFSTSVPEGTFDVIVNTAPMKKENDACPLENEVLARCETVVDIIYSPLRTGLLERADALLKRNVQGTGMLLWQGAAAFEKWFGFPAPVEVMRKALRL